MPQRGFTLVELSLVLVNLTLVAGSPTSPGREAEVMLKFIGDLVNRNINP